MQFVFFTCKKHVLFLIEMTKLEEIFIKNAFALSTLSMQLKKGGKLYLAPRFLSNLTLIIGFLISKENDS